MKHINYLILILIVVVLLYLYNIIDHSTLPTDRLNKEVKSTLVKGKKLRDSVLNTSELIDLKKQQDETKIDSLYTDIEQLKHLLSN